MTGKEHGRSKEKACVLKGGGVGESRGCHREEAGYSLLLQKHWESSWVGGGNQTEASLRCQLAEHRFNLLGTWAPTKAFCVHESNLC